MQVEMVAAAGLEIEHKIVGEDDFLSVFRVQV